MTGIGSSKDNECYLIPVCSFVGHVCSSSFVSRQTVTQELNCVVELNSRMNRKWNE